MCTLTLLLEIQSHTHSPLTLIMDIELIVQGITIPLIFSFGIFGIVGHLTLYARKVMFYKCYKDGHLFFF